MSDLERCQAMMLDHLYGLLEPEQVAEMDAFFATAEGEPLRRQDAVDQHGERRECDQRDVERRPHLHGKGEPVRGERHREGEHEAPEPRIGRGARVGDHEESED